MLLAAAGFVLFGVSAVLGFYAVKQTNKAKEALLQVDRAKEVVERQRDKAEAALAEVERAQLEMAKTNLANGKTNMQLGNYTVAIENFRSVEELKSVLEEGVVEDNKAIFAEAASLKDRATKEGGAKKTYDRYMELGNASLRNGRYRDALSNFKQARNLNLNPTSTREANLKIEEVSNQLVPEFKRLLNQADVFINADNCNLGKQKIKAAERVKNLLPSNKLSQSDLDNLENLRAKCQ